MPQKFRHMPEKTHLNVGYVRLTDSAPLIVASEQKFFEKHGLHVTLKREKSWASIRDKLATGILDAAQMLAPMPLATRLGLENMASPFITGLMLSLNGNAITLATGLCRQMEPPGDSYLAAVDAATALKRIIDSRQQQLTLATVYPFSMHTFQLRQWLRSGGINLKKDVNLIVLPPEQMVENLSRGSIDGFCVGEPWNTVAVQAGVGEVLATGYEIWNNAPEKVLAVMEPWHLANPNAHLRLRMAVMEAQAWLAQDGNRQKASRFIASPCYLDLPRQAITPSLLGHFQRKKNGPTINNPDFHVFHRYHAGFPWRSRAEWLLRRTYEVLDKPIECEDICPLIKKVYRTDLYRQAALALGRESPSLDFKSEGTQDKVHRFENGIELGPDLILGNQRFTPCLC